MMTWKVRHYIVVSLESSGKSAQQVLPVDIRTADPRITEQEIVLLSQLQNSVEESIFLEIRTVVPLASKFRTFFGTQILRLQGRKRVIGNLHL
jgi:hypothetical protein